MSNRRLYLKALFFAFLIEAVVLVLTLFAMLDGFMVHSQIAAAQRPILLQFLGWCGIVFHLPSIFLTVWFFPPLAPLVQILLMSLPIYLRLKFIKGFERSELRKATG